MHFLQSEQRCVAQGSRDLLTWTRYPFGWEGDTGSIPPTPSGIYRMWPQGGAAGAIARSELLGNDTASLSHWSAPTTVVPIPKGLANATVGNFRDPSRAVQLPDGKWYLAVGSDDGRHGGPGKPDITKDGVAAMRLFRASDDTLSNWSAPTPLRAATIMPPHPDGALWQDGCWYGVCRGGDAGLGQLLVGRMERYACQTAAVPRVVSPTA